MARHDPSSAEVLVFTFKEGLLSAVAHDLKLRVGRFTIEVDGGAARGEFDARSLSVVCAVQDGKDAPAALSEVMRAEIERNAARDVLDASRHPSIRFETTSVTPAAVAGNLTLCGVTRPVRGERHDQPGRAVAEFRLDQRDFGIRPYSAMFGTLKIKPEVRVVVSIPAP